MICSKTFKVQALLLCSLALTSFNTYAGPGEKAQLQKTIEDRLENAYSKIIDSRLFVLSVEVVEKSKGVVQSKPVAATTPAQSAKTGQNDFLSKLGFESGETTPTFETAEARAADWLEEIKVKITFDDGVKDESIKLVEEVTSDMIGSLQDKKVRIATNKVSFATLASVKSEKAFDSGWDQKRWLFEMGVPLGIVFAGIIIALFSLFSVFLFVSKFAKVEKQKMTLFESFIALQAEKSVAGEVIEESIPTEQSLITQDAVQGALPDRNGGLDAFAKFQTLITEQPERALRLVQQWLHGKSTVYKETLAVLARNITPHELAHLFKDLKDDERREWRRALRINIDGSVHSRVEDFLSQQIVDVMIVAKSSPEESIMGVLGKMGMDDFIKVAESDSLLGAALLNILSPEQASKLVSVLSPETFKKISVQALSYKEEDLAEVGKKLEVAAKKIKADTKVEVSSPFMERIPALLRDADTSKEEVLFGALVDAKEYGLLQDLGVQNFPSALVPKLPQDFIKGVLMSMPSSARAELIFGLDEDLKNNFLEALGDATSKSRTMITDEISEIKEDALRAKRLEAKKLEIWSQFLKRVRGSIVSRPERLEVAKKIVQDWIQEIGGPRSDEQKDSGGRAA